MSTLNVSHYAPHAVSVMQGRFRVCTVNVDVDVQTCCLDDYTSCSVGNVYNKFQGCTVDIQAATEFLTIST